MIKPRVSCGDVKKTRHAAGMTQKQVADLLDVTERTYQLWETVSGMRQRDYNQFIALAINPTTMVK